jgi:hypothetical protein
MTRKTIDINAYLAKRHQIAVTWCVADVLEVRPDLSDNEAWEVLQTAKKYHDCDCGITWDTLRIHADYLFGTTPETDDAEEA